jgi:hypothetical protein
MSQTQQGAIKCAAVRIGVPVDQYRALAEEGLKRCTCCKVWHSVGEYGIDRSRFDRRSPKCKTCAAQLRKRRYTPVHPDFRKPKGPTLFPNRNGDKRQARIRVNQLVRRGAIPAPSDLPCALCGHIKNDLRHEYHHHKGYAPEHHTTVIPVCSRCHHKVHPRKAA